jgi:hypothetical protein
MRCWCSITTATSPTRWPSRRSAPWSSPACCGRSCAPTRLRHCCTVLPARLFRPSAARCLHQLRHPPLAAVFARAGGVEPGRGVRPDIHPAAGGAAVSVPAPRWFARPWPGASLGAAYLGLSAVQQQRAEQAALALAQARGHQPSQLSVKPTLANLVLWRGLYVHDGRVQADAFHLGLRCATIRASRGALLGGRAAQRCRGRRAAARRHRTLPRLFRRLRWWRTGASPASSAMRATPCCRRDRADLGPAMARARGGDRVRQPPRVHAGHARRIFRHAAGTRSVARGAIIASDARLHHPPPAVRDPDPDRGEPAHLRPVLRGQYAGRHGAHAARRQARDARGDREVEGRARLRQAAAVERQGRGQRGW